MYAVGDDKLLIVASDRISAFDVILDDPIPGQGIVLTELPEFWLKQFAHRLPNHSTDIDPMDVVAACHRAQVAGRARSAEGRVGKEVVSKCRSRWSRYP